MPIDSSNDQALWFAVHRLYAAEARYLDQEDYERWFGLLTDDLHYWMPTRETRFRRDETPPDPQRMNFYRETLESLRMRASRLETGTAWSENPRTRYRHLITNLEVFPAGGNEIRALSNFIVYRHRLEREEAWLVGQREDLLRTVEGELRIARRTILLDQSVLLSKNLNVYL
jgi:ethylbenzene dioxygenase beta subunit